MMMLGRMMQMASGHSKGVFTLSMDDNLFNATDNNGFSQSGTLTCTSAGAINWVGDAGGVDETGTHTWFVGSVSGTWHVKINHLTGLNALTAGSQEDVWRPLSSDVGFTWTRASVGGPDTATSTYDLAFSNDAGSTVFANQTITIELRELSP